MSDRPGNGWVRALAGTRGSSLLPSRTAITSSEDEKRSAGHGRRLPSIARHQESGRLGANFLGFGGVPDSLWVIPLRRLSEGKARLPVTISNRTSPNE